VGSAVSRNRFWCILALKANIWGNNFNDFRENQLPKFYRIGMALPYQISDWYGGRPTYHTASGATAAPLM